MSKSVEELIDDFYSDNLTRDDFRDLYEKIKNYDYGRLPPRRRPPAEATCQVRLSDCSAAIVFENGVTLTLHVGGDTTLTYDGNVVEMDDAIALKIPAARLAEAHRHLAGLRPAPAWEAGRERLVRVGTKRAFIRGMVVGKNL